VEMAADGGHASVPAMTAPRCPTCDVRLATGLESPVFPFCSQRCKSADLGNWLTGRYVIDAGAVEEESASPADLGDGQGPPHE